MELGFEVGQSLVSVLLDIKTYCSVCAVGRVLFVGTISASRFIQKAGTQLVDNSEML